MTNQTPHDLGRAGEKYAAEYLKEKGFRVVETGYRLYRGEIDIIAYQGKTLVFIEVKTRRGERFGEPEEAVTPSKQRQIRRIAEGYLAHHRLNEVPCRFDVLAVTREKNRGFCVRHFKEAFE